MTRPIDRDHLCLDIELIRPIREEGYKSLSATASVIGVKYDVLRRVVHGQSCTEEEELLVRQAWARFAPDAVMELLDLMVDRAECGQVLEIAYAKQLRDAVQRVLRVAEGE